MKTFSLALSLLLLAGSQTGLRGQSDPVIIWSQQDPVATTQNAAIAYSPNDALVASGRQDDNDTQVWDAGTGAFVRTLNGRDNDANVIRFSPDSQYLATGTGGGGATLNLNLWRVSDGVRLVGRIHAFNNGTISLAFSSDGQLLAAAGFHANNYKIYHVPDMALVADVGNFDPDLGYNVRTNAVAFSPDGQLIALGDNRGVHLRRVSDGSLVRILNTNAPNVMKTNSVAFTPDGQYVAAGVHVVDSTFAHCIDCAIKMFRVSDGALVRIFENGNNMQFPKIAFSPGGTIIGAAFSHDQADTGAVQFWDVNTGHTVQTDMFELWPWDFAFSRLGNRYAFYSASGLFGVAKAPYPATNRTPPAGSFQLFGLKAESRAEQVQK
jgi:WD40 repeat protein